jgi:uncharacterized membrane protein YcaP (DUF421 family)
MFFTDWWHIGRTLVVGSAAYVLLVLMLRISGKRTLSKLNAFDLVVTVALGSTLATVLLSKDVPLSVGLTAFAVLIGLQAVVTWLSVRSPWVAARVKSEPRLLMFQGQLLQQALREERITEAEVQAAVRASGRGGMEAVVAVVLETDGSLSVVSDPQKGPFTALNAVAGAQAPPG